MKNNIKAEINGREFFKTYIIFLIPILLLVAISNRTNGSSPFISNIASLVQSYLSMLLGFAFFRYGIQAVFFKEKGFGFSGTMKEIAPKYLKWYLLTIITLGIYSPWYIRNFADYYLNRTSYEDKNGEFHGKPGSLLKYMLLTLYLPVIILAILFSVYVFRNAYYDYYNWAAVGVPTFGFVLLIFLVLVPFMYFYFAWLINVSFNGKKTVFNRSMSEFAGFLIPQILLSAITLFIYYPAAMVKIYRYLLNGSSFVDENNTEKGGFGFDGTAGKGFGLLWGQGLLTLITIGIYGPWAMSKVSNWFLNNTYIESNE